MAKALDITNPMKAIRLKCLDCVCHQEKLSLECTIMTCALWPYRMGRYPKAGPGG
jgi:hypothetical protein